MIGKEKNQSAAASFEAKFQRLIEGAEARRLASFGDDFGDGKN